MYFFLNSCDTAEAAAVIPNGAKIFSANRTATFINGPANLLNNESKDPTDWIILDIWASHNFISVDILLSITFLDLAVCLVENNNSWGKLFH